MKKDVVEELFQKYYNKALLYTLTLTKNRHLAEDIVSTAFFKALKTADGKVTDFKAWLMRVCRNTYYDHYKWQKRYEVLDENIVDDSEQAVERIIRDEKYQALYHAINLLNDSQKEVITLFYFEDMKISDICLITGKTADNVKVLLYRGRENVKKILEITK